MIGSFKVRYGYRLVKKEQMHKVVINSNIIYHEWIQEKQPEISLQLYWEFYLVY